MIRIMVLEAQPGREFLADAMASDKRVGIGGWEFLPGRPKEKSPWYAEEITPEMAPWLFRKGRDQAFRMIAALEMIATIACVRLFGSSANHEGKMVRLSGATDNKGNSHVVSKSLTTKFPLCVVLMQLTADLGERGFELDLRWTPREENVLADALSNGDTTGMDPALRKRFELSDLRTLAKLLVADLMWFQK